MKMKVQGITSGGCVILVPVVAHEIVHTDDKGKKVSSAQIEKLDDKSKRQLKRSKVLTENTSFWSQNPSANFRLVPDTEEGKKEFAVGDVFEVILKKA